MVELTGTQLYGVVLISGGLGGTAAVLAPKFLAWTDRRRLDKAERTVLDVFPEATRVPEQRRADW